MSQMCLTDVRQLLERFPPSTFFNLSDVLLIDQNVMEKELTRSTYSPEKKYLEILSKINKNRKLYQANDPKSVGLWLTEITYVFDALEELVCNCDDLSAFDNDKTWVKGLAIQKMQDVIQYTKDELNILKKNLYRLPNARDVRERVVVVLLRNLAYLMDMLITIIQVEKDEVPPSKMVSVIGKGSSISQLFAGA